MSSLPTPLRRQLESAVKQARKVAAAGARKALEALAVHESEPYAYMDAAQIELRRKLRAQAAQLGDKEVLGKPGSCEIKHLVEKLAYDQWHRLLFARYLVENNLLISPDHGVSVSLDDCEELAPSLGLKDSWAVAARFAAKELPEIFRADDPAGAVELPAENRKPLIQLVTGLPVEVFTAGDSLGWCYQFWQAERKDEVNAAGNKIGANELPAVTQLFTEDYMVDFLLDNTLGAWHAGKWLAANPSLAETAQSEDELRAAVSLPCCPWSYLRFIKSDDGKWVPAAGTFAGWPKTAKEVTCLDPCMGSGHFVVAMFERMVALRMAEQLLDESTAVAEVIRDNVFGLEIDPRCTQIAAFNLALAAWRRIGHCTLPAMNLACSGLAPNAKREDWLRLAGNDERLRNGMDRLYRLFEDAPVLGSLVNPKAKGADLLVAGFQELRPLMHEAMAREGDNDPARELAVSALGIAKAADILAQRFTLVATNVPYLGRGKQDQVLRDFCERNYSEAKADLATCFVERCIQFTNNAGTSVLVSPQNWLFLGTYSALRKSLLETCQWNVVIKLGSNAFQDMNWWAATTSLIIVSQGHPKKDHPVAGLDVGETKDQREKALGLSGRTLARATQSRQLENPDARINLDGQEQHVLLMAFAAGVQGLATHDDQRFACVFWEFPSIGYPWECLAGTVETSMLYGGRSYLFKWGGGGGEYKENAMALKAEGRLGGWKSGKEAWGKLGVSVSQMRILPCTLYTGDFFDHSAAAVIPNDPANLAAVWCFCTSSEFHVEVRKIDQAVKVTNASLVKIPFDLTRWTDVAAERYPTGLPKPFSTDPTQWLFDGQPRRSDNPLHVAVARLLGYQWPCQTGSSFPDCPARDPDGLETLADADGIVCLSATKGEPAAAERLRGLLAQAYGENWNASVQQDLHAQVGYAGKTLDDWLRDGFFEQHCALFHHRPFIWHIWDGNKNGFSALVNYHKLNCATLESLTYSYLGLWIQRQQAAVDAGEAGSDARLEAAKQLQAKLKLILEGEPPYDIFVRWKPLSKQAIGWHPDLNDGVRINIRPFATADILRKRVKIKWDKDRGKEPVREQKDFPWFWGWDGKTEDFAGAGTEPDGNRWNDLHYSNEAKRKARGE
jgi:hypothetical protein